MEWNNFEENMRESLNSPPSPNTEELEKSWNRLEPKLFPKKNRRALWFSLSAILLLVSSLIAVSQFKSRDAKSPQRDKVMAVESSNSSSYNTQDMQGASSSSVSSQRKSSTKAYSNAGVEQDLQNHKDQSKSQSKALQIKKDKLASTSRKVKSQKDVAHQSNSSIAAKEGSKPSSKQNAVTSSKDKIKGPQEPMKSPANAYKAEASSYSIAQDAMDNSTSINSPNQNIVTTANLKSKILDNKASYVSMEKNENGEVFESKTVLVDSENIISHVFSKPADKAMILDEAEDEDELEEALLQEEVKDQSKKKENKIKSKVKNEESLPKVTKPRIVSIHGAYSLGTKAAYPYTGGILGLEVLQELGYKLHLMAGLRYRQANLNKNLLDSSVNSQVYHRVDSAAIGVTYFYFHQNVSNKSYKVSNAQIIEIPVYIGYDLLKRLMLQMGVDISYLLKANVTSVSSWSTQIDRSEDVDFSNAANYQAPSSDFMYNANDFRNKLGLSFHIGMQYSISSRVYASMALDKMLNNYFKPSYTQTLNKTIGAPQIQFGLGYRFNKKKK